MPNPKVGTVTNDVAQAVRDAKGGAVEFRVEKAGIVHAGVGKASFTAEALDAEHPRPAGRGEQGEAVRREGHLSEAHRGEPPRRGPACASIRPRSQRAEVATSFARACRPGSKSFAPEAQAARSENRPAGSPVRSGSCPRLQVSFGS